MYADRNGVAAIPVRVTGGSGKNPLAVQEVGALPAGVPVAEPSGAVATGLGCLVAGSAGAVGESGAGAVVVGAVVLGAVVDGAGVDGAASAAAGLITGPVPQAWISERPTLCVDALTEVSVTRNVVVVRAGKVTVVAPPELSRAGTFTVDPSEKVSVAPVTWSPVFGRSKRTTPLSCTGPGQVSWSQLPAPPPEVAHSAV